MSELVLSFEKDDFEMREALETQFGEQVTYQENKGFNGLEIFVTAVVPISGLTIQIIDFLLTYLHSDSNSDDSKKRVLIKPDGYIDLRGYTQKEACKIIKCYFTSNDDK